jgi:hypothetical protein
MPAGAVLGGEHTGSLLQVLRVSDESDTAVHLPLSCRVHRVVPKTLLDPSLLLLGALIYTTDTISSLIAGPIRSRLQVLYWAPPG